MTNFCIPCCRRVSTENHHIKTRGAGGTNDDDNLMELCRECHVKWHTMGPIKFIKLFPHMEYFLSLKGWKIENCFGALKLVRS